MVAQASRVAVPEEFSFEAAPVPSFRVATYEPAERPERRVAWSWPSALRAGLAG